MVEPVENVFPANPFDDGIAPAFAVFDGGICGLLGFIGTRIDGAGCDIPDSPVFVCAIIDDGFVDELMLRRWNFALNFLGVVVEGLNCLEQFIHFGLVQLANVVTLHENGSFGPRRQRQMPR